MTLLIVRYLNQEISQMHIYCGKKLLQNILDIRENKYVLDHKKLKDIVLVTVSNYATAWNFFITKWKLIQVNTGTWGRK